MVGKKIFYPKILFVDLGDENENFIKKFNKNIKLSYAKNYIETYQYTDISHRQKGEINSNMRKLSGKDKIVLPGEKGSESDELKFCFINIIVTNDKNSDSLREKLQKIHDATEFEDNEDKNINFYILIVEKLVDLENISGEIKGTNIGQIVISKKYYSGQTVKKNHHLSTLINVASAIALFGTQADLIKSLFFHKPDHVLTARADIISFPDEPLQNYIDAVFLRELYDEISRDDEKVEFSIDDLLHEEIFKNDEDLLKWLELPFYKNRELSIPFYQTRDNRNYFIEEKIINYTTLKGRYLSKKTKEIKEKKDLFNNVQNQDIDINLYIKIRDKLSETYCVGSILERVKFLIKELNDRLVEKNSWRFIPENLKNFNVSSFPFHYALMAVLGVFVLTNIIFLLSSIDIGSKIGMSAITVLYFLILFIGGKQFINKKNEKLRGLINNDEGSIKEFFVRNVYSFRLSNNKFLYNNLIKGLKQHENKLEKLLKNLNERLNHNDYKNLIENISKSTDKKRLEGINSSVKHLMPSIVTRTMANNTNAILNDIENAHLFIDSALNEFHKSEEYMEIIKSLIDSNNIDNRFDNINTFMTTRNVKEESIKKILIAPFEHAGDNYKQILGETKLDTLGAPVISTWHYLIVGNTGH